MNIIFDLDGTLIDSKQRLHYLFQKLVPCSTLSYEEYWELKKNKISNEMILISKFGYDNKNIDIFTRKWMSLIESRELLKLDLNFPNIHDFLIRLRKDANLHICTARQLYFPVLEQLTRLNLLPFFDQILVTEQKYSKEILINSHITELCDQDWIIGDTGKDIQAGKILAIRTCAVLSGFLNEENLRAYNPDKIFNSVRDFNPFV